MRKDHAPGQTGSAGSARRSGRKWLVAIAAAVVLSCTADAVILPAAAVEAGAEHQRTEMCYTLAALSAGGETLTLSEREPEDNTPFEVKNMFPGDSVTQYYNVKVKHKSDMTLSFHADIREGYDKLAEVLECRVVLSDSGEELYSGLMRDMPESLDTALEATGSATSEVRYEITVSLPTSVGNDYMSKALVADFRWWVEREEEPEPTEPSYEPEPPVVIVSPEPTDEPSPEPTDEPPTPTDTPPDTGDQPPKTGDDSNIALWGTAAGVSLLMLILLLIKRKKEEPADEN